MRREVASGAAHRRELLAVVNVGEGDAERDVGDRVGVGIDFDLVHGVGVEFSR